MTSREDNRRLAEAYAEAMGIGDTNLPDELTDIPDNFTHNYSGCQEPVCALCDAYGEGIPQARKWLTSRSATGIPSSTRLHAAAIRVWPRGR